MYLNEFITRNPDWLTTLNGVTQDLHTKLQEEGRSALEVLEAAGDREERFSRSSISTKVTASSSTGSGC
jgi:hypothetical protein